MTLFLCGDVMLGRGVDQILPHPGDPTLREPYIRDARDYVRLAEAGSGSVPRPAGFAWPWGAALEILEECAPDVRLVNLETAVTRAGAFEPGKGIHYRMHPSNLGCLQAIRPDVCALANNHVLDFGREGLTETLGALARAGIATAGAGRNAGQARRPAAVPLAGGGRVLVFSFALPTSGVPHGWAATEHRAGVDFVPDTTEESALAVTARIRHEKRPGDLVVVSVHWGSNWGYEVPPDHRRFAHALVDGGADLVHGHSSHHPRPLELYREKPVLYGCGDFINDYEGITGYEQYRDDLRLMYLISVNRGTGRALQVRMVPLRSERLRLLRASPPDSAWLRDTLDRACRGFGSRVVPGPDGTLVLGGG